MSEHDAEDTPQSAEGSRLDRLEETLSQLAEVMTSDREAVQRELRAVTVELGSLLPGGADSSGITTGTGSDSSGITPTETGAGEAEEDDDSGLTGWADSATAQEWAGLVAWVDWLSATYQLGDLGVRSCWPAHGAAIEELAGLKMAWEYAIGACAEKDWVGVEALAYWHDRYLPGVLGRLMVMHGLRSCKRQHEEGTPPLVTDTSFVVIRATGEVPDLAGSAR